MTRARLLFPTLFAILLGGLLGLPARAQAQLVWEIPPALAGDAGFGTRVAASGNYLVATSTLGTNVRHVNIFRRAGAQLYAEYQHVLGRGSIECEIAVHADGDSVTVVACDTLANTVSVYQRTPSGAWSATPLPAGPASVNYGAALATNGAWIAVGAPLDPVASAYGRVRIYWRSGSTWNLDVIDNAYPQATPSHFGSALSMDAQRLAIGAPDAGPNGSGVVELHALGANGQHTSEWVFFGPTTPPIHHEQFGASVALDGNALVIGQPGFSAPAVSCGLVHVLRRTASTNQWAFISEIAPSNAVANARYGERVALAGSRLLATYGSPSATAATFGAVDLGVLSPIPFFHWYVAQTLVPGPHGNLGDQFGAALAFSGKFAFVGSPGDQIGGRVYAYVHDTLDCNQNGEPDLAEIARGQAADCNLDDVPDGCQVASGALADCNHNGVPDGCDLASGFSVDLNGDLVPDDCQSSSCALAELNAFDGLPGDNLGLSVATDRNRVISGAPNSDPFGSSSGSAYVYRRDGVAFVQEARLVAPDGAAHDEFGSAVELYGDVALVGAPGDDDRGPNAGSVYAFRRDPTTGTWTFESKFYGIDTNAGDGFGGALALRIGLTSALLVGASGADTPAGPQRGKVYVFERVGPTWNERNRLFALDGQSGDVFGASIDAVGAEIAIGAPYANSSGQTESGAVYVGRLFADLAAPVTFARRQQTVPVAGSRLGTSVALDPDGFFLAAGAFEDPTRGIVAGSVMVYVRDLAGAWNNGAQLFGSDTNAWDNFGRGLAWAENQLIVGSPFKDTAGALGSGALTVFHLTVGGALVETQRIAPPDANLNQGYGFSLAWLDGVLVTGAYGDDLPHGTDSGSVYVLGLGGPDRGADGECDVCQIAAGALSDVNGNLVDDAHFDAQSFCAGAGWNTPCPCGNESGARGGCRNSFGSGSTLYASGTTARSSSNDVTLFVSQLPPSSTSVTFFQGSGAIESGTPFGDGLYCVSGSILRLATVASLSGTAGIGHDVSGTPDIAVRGQIPPAGGTRYYQALYRNAANFCTSATLNTTNGVSLVWRP